MSKRMPWLRVMESMGRFGRFTGMFANDAEVEISQPYQSEPDGKGSQSEGNPIETALGEQVPEGWFITGWFTARIGVFTVRLLGVGEERGVDRHVRW